ncbi:MAG: helical backbone metal receptor [Chloroflexota bacterium]
MKKATLLLFALLLVVALATACASNDTPAVTSLTAHPPSLLPGETTDMTCVASDPDGDTLTYSWSADDGTISGVGSQVNWIAPGDAGTYAITVTVSDGQGEEVHETCYVVVAAPTPTPTATPSPTPTPTPTPTPEPKEIVDDLGRTVVLEETPQRIVSLAPSNTEVLFALGLGDKVVGVSDFCDYPQELLDRIDAGDIVRVGSEWPGFSLETIVSLTPDVAFAIGETVPDYVEDLEGLGVPVAILQPHSIAGIFHDIELVGQIADEEQAAQDLIVEMQDHMVSICETTADGETEPTVFYELDATNPALPWTAGSGTFIDILITLAGGDNIASGLEDWAQFSLEELVASDPDMIILGDYPWVSPEDVMGREGWQDLSAVQNEAIYSIDPDLVSRPGPRIFDGLEDLAAIIHPELFE